jgi:(5-formylfuran-3-yl)methyl phosphate synthase
MKVLVSPQNVAEALICLSAGVEIVDVKNPEEGSLGANFPWVIEEIKSHTKGRALLSATLGDVPFKPGTISQAALGAVIAGADYIKVGLYGISTTQETYAMMKAVKRAADMAKRNITVVACSYADAAKIGAISPQEAIIPVKEAGCDGIMIDTAVKDGRDLFASQDVDALKLFVNTAREHGLLSALAGSIRKENLRQLAIINPDIIGVRGAVCESRDRVRGKMTKELIEDFLSGVKLFSASSSVNVAEASL